MSPRATSPFLQDFVDVSVKSKQFVHVAKGERSAYFYSRYRRNTLIFFFFSDASGTFTFSVIVFVYVNCTFDQRVQSVERMRIRGQQHATSSFLFFSFFFLEYTIFVLPTIANQKSKQGQTNKVSLKSRSIIYLSIILYHIKIPSFNFSLTQRDSLITPLHHLPRNFKGIYF